MIFVINKQVGFKLVVHFWSVIIFFSVQSTVLAEDHRHDHTHEYHEHREVSEIKENDHSHQHESHDGHEEPELVFSSIDLKEFSIKTTQATSGAISKTLALTGEVIVAPERLFHIVPRVSGVVRQVYKHLGDDVKKGDLLATLSSRDLADAKAEFVAADSLLKLANSTLIRERNLYKNKVTAKRNYLAARQSHIEISIRRKAAQQRLLALGLSEHTVASVLKEGDRDLTLYELLAPADGVIIEQHAVQGEILETHDKSFTLADLSQVWVNLTVYQKDLTFIKQGQEVTIMTGYTYAKKQIMSVSRISWLSPLLNELTRSATARVVIDNSDGYWRPGLFVSAKVAIEELQADIVIPLSAIQTIDGNNVVFVYHEDGRFEPQAIILGRRDHHQVEIVQGLTIGQRYVSENAFSLKAQMQKASFGHGHSH